MDTILLHDLNSNKYKLIISLILLLLKSATILIYYVITDKSNSINRSKMEYILIFVCSDLFVLYDIILSFRSKSKSKQSTLIVVLCIILLFSFVSKIAISLTDALMIIPTSQGSENQEIVAFYDRFGNKYSSQEQIIFYTFDNAEFCYVDCDDEFVCVKNNSMNNYLSSYSAISTYIDMDGYLVFCDEILSFDNSKGDFGFFDKTNNKYYGSARDVFWSSNGSMYFVY